MLKFATLPSLVVVTRCSLQEDVVAAWCAKDPNEALDKAFSGGSNPEVTCENAIMDQYNLGISLGVQGTPAIYLDDGQMVPGYRPAAALLRNHGPGK